MSSENPSGADNQQERPNSIDWLNEIPVDLGNWISGFVDGEGSFNIPIRRVSDRGLPWRVSLSFNVSQIGPDIPELLKFVFEAGTVRGRGDGVFYFEVTRLNDLQKRIIPFFERFPLRSPKRHDYEIFVECVTLVQSGRHLTCSGILEVLSLRAPMNRGGKRRRSDMQIIAAIKEAGILRGHTQSSLFEAEG